MTETLNAKTKRSALLDLYRTKSSLHGKFFRAYRVWKEAIQNNKWR